MSSGVPRTGGVGGNTKAKKRKKRQRRVKAKAKQKKKKERSEPTTTDKVTGTEAKPSNTPQIAATITPHTVSQNWKALKCVINTPSKGNEKGGRRRKKVKSRATASGSTSDTGSSTGINKRHKKKRRFKGKWSDVKLPALVKQRLVEEHQDQQQRQRKGKIQEEMFPRCGTPRSEAEGAAEREENTILQLHRKKDLLTPVNQSEELTNVVAIDCEMVGVGAAGKNSELARVCIVNSFGNVVYHSFVQPLSQVTDYRTKHSGIRKEDIEHAPPFKKVQKEVAALLKDRIVVGHALKNDFRALLLSHPRLMTRDTATYRPLQMRPGKPYALRKLAKKIFNVDIQTGEHSPVEDARMALLLYKHHRHEWEKLFEKRRMKKTYGRGKKRKPAEKTKEDISRGDDAEQSNDSIEQRATAPFPSWLKPVNKKNIVDDPASPD